MREDDERHERRPNADERRPNAGEGRRMRPDDNFDENENEGGKDEKVSKKNRNKIVFIFILTFIIVFILFFQIAQLLVPNVDVEIGGADDEEVQNQKEEEVEKMIDERLKWIQFEDNSIRNSEENIDNAVETQYVPEKLDKEGAPPEEKAPEVKPKTIMQEKQVVVQEEIRPKIIMNKVYVGNYATIEEAMSEQTRIMDAMPGVTLYIKGLGGSFTLQAGSFSDREKAEALATRLSENGVPCRIVKE